MSEISFDEALHRFATAGKAFAQARAARTKLESVVKSIKAEAYLKARANGATVADADATSRRDSGYLAAIGELAAAVEREESERIKADAMRIWLEWMRTLEATRRAEMNLAR